MFVIYINWRNIILRKSTIKFLTSSLINGKIKDMDTSSWKLDTAENKQAELDKYGEVYVYGNKIVPREYLTKKMIAWFRDEEVE